MNAIEIHVCEMMKVNKIYNKAWKYRYMISLKNRELSGGNINSDGDYILKGKTSESKLYSEQIMKELRLTFEDLHSVNVYNPLSIPDKMVIDFYENIINNTEDSPKKIKTKSNKNNLKLEGVDMIERIGKIVELTNEIQRLSGAINRNKCRKEQVENAISDFKNADIGKTLFDGSLSFDLQDKKRFLDVNIEPSREFSLSLLAFIKDAIENKLSVYEQELNDCMKKMSEITGGINNENKKPKHDD